MNTNNNEPNKSNPGDEKKQTAPIAPSNPNEHKEKVVDKPGTPDPKIASPNKSS